MTRQLEVVAYLVLLVGLAGTWVFARTAIVNGTPTVPGTVGLYAMTGLPFALAAAGSRWVRDSLYASGWLLTVWIAGVAVSYLVLFGSRGELLGEFTVFMLPVLHVPTVALAVLIGWGIRRSTQPRAGAS